MICTYWKMLANARWLDIWLTAGISRGEDGGRLLECETFVYFPDSLAWRLQKGTAMESMIFQSCVKQRRAEVRGDASKWLQYRNALWGDGILKWTILLVCFPAVFFFLISVNNRGAHNTGGFGSMHAFQGRQNTVTHLNANRSYD